MPALAAAGAVSRPGLDAAPGDELRRSPAAFKKTPKFYTLLPGAAKHATYYEESSSVVHTAAPCTALQWCCCAIGTNHALWLSTK